MQKPATPTAAFGLVQLSLFTTSVFELIQMSSFSTPAIELIQKPSFRTAAIGRIKLLEARAFFSILPLPIAFSHSSAARPIRLPLLLSSCSGGCLLFLSGCCLIRLYFCILYCTFAIRGNASCPMLDGCS